MDHAELMKQKDLLTFRKKETQSRRKIRSVAWTKFHQIFDETNGSSVLVKNWVKCIKCESFVKYNGETTSKLLAHICSDQRNQITNFIHSNEPKDIAFSADDIKSIRDASSKFIVKDVRPYYAIEGEGLICLLMAVLALAKKYPRLDEKNLIRILPSRNTLKDHINAQSETMRGKMKAIFAQALEFPSFLAATADLWKDSYRSNTYLSFVSHICTLGSDAIVRNSFVFHLGNIDEMVKTNQVLYNEKVAVFESFDISESTANERVKWVTDRGENVRIAYSKEDSVRFNCLAHVINNIVEDMCKKTDEAKKIIANASSLVTYMKRSGLNARLKKTLMSHVETRWNTVYYTINSIIVNYVDTLKLLNEREVETRDYSYARKITCLDENDLKSMRDFLELFTTITTDIEGEKKPTLHKVWPYYLKIIKYLEPAEHDSNLIIKMKRSGRKYIETNGHKFQLHIDQKLACFLHPMFKALSFAPLTEVIEVHQYAESKIKHELESQSSPISANQSSSSKQSTCSILDEFVADSSHTATSDSLELRNYMAFNVKVSLLHESMQY